MKKIICLIIIATIGVSILAGCNSNARQIEENNRLIDQYQKNIDDINKVQEQSKKVQDLIDAYQNK